MKGKNVLTGLVRRKEKRKIGERRRRRKEKEKERKKEKTAQEKGKEIKRNQKMKA